MSLNIFVCKANSVIHFFSHAKVSVAVKLTILEKNEFLKVLYNVPKWMKINEQGRNSGTSP